MLQVLKRFLISSRKDLPQNKLKVSKRAPPGLIILSITLHMRATENNTGKKFDVVLTVHRRQYVEIKCQLDATDEFLLQILLLAQHVSGTIMPIIRNSSVLYKWLLPVVFGAWFSSCRYGVELRVVCPVCGLLRY